MHESQREMSNGAFHKRCFTEGWMSPDVCRTTQVRHGTGVQKRKTKSGILGVVTVQTELSLQILMSLFRREVLMREQHLSFPQSSFSGFSCGLLSMNGCCRYQRRSWVIPCDWQQQDLLTVSPRSPDLHFGNCGSTEEEIQTLKIAHKSVSLNCIRNHNIIF